MFIVYKIIKRTITINTFYFILFYSGLSCALIDIDIPPMDSTLEFPLYKKYNSDNWLVNCPIMMTFGPPMMENEAQLVYHLYFTDRITQESYRIIFLCLALQGIKTHTIA